MWMQSRIPPDRGGLSIIQSDHPGDLRASGPSEPRDSPTKFWSTISSGFTERCGSRRPGRGVTSRCVTVGRGGAA
jgi:hypothetical protein